MQHVYEPTVFQSLRGRLHIFETVVSALQTVSAPSRRAGLAAAQVVVDGDENLTLGCFPLKPCPTPPLTV